MYLRLPGQVAARITMHSARVSIAPPCAVDYNINEFQPDVWGRASCANNFALLRLLLSKEISFRQLPYKGER